MKLAELKTTCDQCGAEYADLVRVFTPDEYTGTILKTFWCLSCKAPQVIRYQFKDDVPQVVERLEPKAVLVPKEPDTGITIRPRQGKGHNR